MIGLLGRRIIEAARVHADRWALEGDSVQLTYRELLDRASALAGVLEGRRMRRDATVLVRFSNDPLDFVALLGVWMAGGVAVPIHRTTPAEVVRSIQAKAKASLQVDLRDGTEAEAAVSDLDGKAASDRAVLKDAALVIFTSGSTGTPKGVVLTHDRFAAKLDQHQHSYGYTCDDRILLVLNNTFSFGTWISLLTLSHGASLVIPSKFTPSGFLETLSEAGITHVGVVPTMMRAIFSGLSAKDLESFAARIRQQGKLRDVCIGGEALSIDLSLKLRDFIAPAGLYDGYGSTETATGDTLLLPDEFAAHPNSIGRCMPGIQYRIVNEDGVCAAGTAGELQIDTPYIMAGYLDDDELTKAAFDGQWFKTGDAVVDDGEGYLRIVGRMKELIVRGGNKITPLEVELALSRCTGVASAMVCAVSDPVLGQRIQALIVPAQGCEVHASLLRAELRGRLERFKLPDLCFVAEALPTGRTGKLDRRLLPELVEDGRAQPLAGWVAGS